MGLELKLRSCFIHRTRTHRHTHTGTHTQAHTQHTQAHRPDILRLAFRNSPGNGSQLCTPGSNHKSNIGLQIGSPRGGSRIFKRGGGGVYKQKEGGGGGGRSWSNFGPNVKKSTTWAKKGVQTPWTPWIRPCQLLIQLSN